MKPAIQAFVATLAAITLVPALSGDSSAAGSARIPGAFVLAQYKPQLPYRPRINLHPPVPKLQLCNGPDLTVSAMMLYFTHVYDPGERSPHAEYVVEPIVKNIGPKDWKSGANQQGVILDVESSRGASHQVAANMLFPVNLRSGNSGAALSWHDGWVKGSGEFQEPPHGYRAYLTYDPDIYLDRNPANDDCNRHNQSMVVTSAQVRHAILSRRTEVIIHQ